MTDLQRTLTARLSAATAAAFGPEHASADPQVRPAQNPRFGDYQANAAMGLARRLGRDPRGVAEAIVAHLDASDLCEVPEVAGPGFINLTLRAEALGRMAVEMTADERLGVEPLAQPRTVIIDYSSPNVAKEMHVGHLRSTVIGDAIARTLEFLYGPDHADRVIRQNHLGDWGTQFGMLIEYLFEKEAVWKELPGDWPLSGYGITDLDQYYREAKKRFDEDPDFASRARKRVVLLQKGDEETVERWRFLREESKRHFFKVYERLGVDLIPDDIRSESFYNRKLPEVVEELERQGLTTVSDGAVCVFLDEFRGPDDRPLPLIVRKSDGGYLYATTDLAAIRYRVGELGADRIIYVTDARQKQHFAMVFAVARKAGFAPPDVALEHVPFGTILGADGRPFRTREGRTVRLADLLDEAERRALAIVAEKNPDLDEAQRRRVARIVGIGAVKYGDLSGDRVKDYVFNWERMLAMDGNTAPYLQYAYARIRSIRRKAAEQGLGPGDTSGGGGGDAIRIEHPAERNLVLKLVQFGPTVRAVAESLEPHRLCTWLYDVATAFSAFYENCPVLQARSAPQRRDRLTLCDLTAAALHRGLGLLGIEAPQRM